MLRVSCEPETATFERVPDEDTAANVAQLSALAANYAFTAGSRNGLLLRRPTESVSTASMEQGANEPAARGNSAASMEPAGSEQ